MKGTVYVITRDFVYSIVLDVHLPFFLQQNNMDYTKFNAPQQVQGDLKTYVRKVVHC